LPQVQLARAVILLEFKFNFMQDFRDVKRLEFSPLCFGNADYYRLPQVSEFFLSFVHCTYYPQLGQSEFGEPDVQAKCECLPRLRFGSHVSL